jgi:imidazolonepropionase-like amidohydrolase
VRALDAVDVHDESFWRARSGGITTVNVMPGSGHLMSGQTVYLKLRRDPGSIADWLYCDDPTAGVCGSMKMANGTNSMRDKPFPGTRAKSAAMVRELFVQAQNHVAKRDRKRDEEKDEDGEGGEPPARDLGLEAVAQVLAGERRVQFHTHRHDDIATALRLSREFGFDFVVQHGTESWMLADELAREGIGVSFTLVDSPGGKEEILRMRMDAPALLERAGVEVGLNTDDPITDSRLFLRTAALAVRNGMSRAGALRAVTLAPAHHLGLEERIGSLEPGKDADLVVLSGDPLSTYTEVLETWVEGEIVYDAANPEHRKYAVGGWRVYTPAAAHDDGGCF